MIPITFIDKAFRADLLVFFVTERTAFVLVNFISQVEYDQELTNNLHMRNL